MNKQLAKSAGVTIIAIAIQMASEIAIEENRVLIAYEAIATVANANTISSSMKPIAILNLPKLRIDQTAT